MDKHNIERAMIGLDDHNESARTDLKTYPDHFFASYEANPNNAMEQIRKIERPHRVYGIKAVTGFSSGLCPQVPINDKKWCPIYAKLVEPKFGSWMRIFWEISAFSARRIMQPMAVTLGKWRNAAEDAEIFQKTAERSGSSPKR